jgi:2-succinyl-5-enolpyruvyl-6-hydroxy-3-cyclohexene-1-carboxylate synthase
VVELMDATQLARGILRELLELGISDVVLSPGSRNAPLSIALYEAAKKGFIDLHVRIDERGAAFFALGLAKASDNYVAIVCTSGTAAANYHPAVLEAHHAHNKLIVITADRPARLRGTGANQTTNQSNIYGDVRTHDVAAPIAIAPLLTGGPVHLNVQFDEPLLPSDENDWLAGLEIEMAAELPDLDGQLHIGDSTVVVIGHDRGTFEAELIQDALLGADVPVIAEDPLSFPGAVPHAALFLADEQVRNHLRPQTVIVIGRTTLSRSINAFIANAEKVIIIDPRTETVDTNRTADQKFHRMPAIVGESSATNWWIAAEATAEIIRSDATWSEQYALRTISQSIPDGASLFIGSSRPIRDIEAFADVRDGVSTFANRGLAGIDGNISTSFGIAFEFENNYAVMGDLTFIHDLSALANVPDVNLTLFIIDNNGGGIFSTLPQAGVAGFESIFGTPQNLDLYRAIAGFGLDVERVKTASDIERLINHPQSGVKFVVVEVPPRDTMASELKSVYQSASKAVRIGLNLA